jgi:hypothetical protein
MADLAATSTLNVKTIQLSSSWILFQLEVAKELVKALGLGLEAGLSSIRLNLIL